MSQITIEHEDDWRKLRHAQYLASLQAEDFADHPEVLCALLKSNGEFSDILREALKASYILCRRAVLNEFRNQGIRLDLECPEICEDLEELVKIVRSDLGSTFETVRSFIDVDSHSSKVEQIGARMIPEYRDEALAHMDDHYGHVKLPADPDYALSDEEMAQNFTGGGEQVNQKFLSTYFDSAFEGLMLVKLQEQVDKIGHERRLGYEYYLNNIQEIIIEALESGDPKSPDRRFFPNNIFFEMNGTQAFLLFARSFMRPGSRILAGIEEYDEMLEKLPTGIHVERMEDYRSEAEYLDELEQNLGDKDKKIDFILVSEVGRFGNPYHLEAVNEIRKRVRPGAKLIVDACQSAGRFAHDMKACEADVVLLSVSKGAELGKGLAFFAIAGAMPIKKIDALNGSASPDLLARTAFALNPSKFDELYHLELSDEVRKLILSPEERGRAVKELTQKFLKLVKAINQNHDQRIEIINPMNPENAAHAVEFRVKGVKRDRLHTHLASYGIYVNQDGYKPECDEKHEKHTVRDAESVRIAFHPYMKNDALRILCGALVNCMDKNPL